MVKDNGAGVGVVFTKHAYAIRRAYLRLSLHYISIIASGPFSSFYFHTKSVLLYLKLQIEKIQMTRFKIQKF